jgi:hypothetical protein
MSAGQADRGDAFPVAERTRPACGRLDTRCGPGRGRLDNFGFGAAGIKAIFYRYFTVFRPPRRSIPRLWRHVRPPRPPPTALVRGMLGLPDLPDPSKQSTAADGGAWKGNQSIGSMEGIEFFQKSLRSLRSHIQIIGSNRYACPNRSTGRERGMSGVSMKMVQPARAPAHK